MLSVSTITLDRACFRLSIFSANLLHPRPFHFSYTPHLVSFYHVFDQYSSLSFHSNKMVPEKENNHLVKIHLLVCNISNEDAKVNGEGGRGRGGTKAQHERRLSGSICFYQTVCCENSGRKVTTVKGRRSRENENTERVQSWCIHVHTRQSTACSCIPLLG